MSCPRASAATRHTAHFCKLLYSNMTCSSPLLLLPHTIQRCLIPDQCSTCVQMCASSSPAATSCLCLMLTCQPRQTSQWTPAKRPVAYAGRSDSHQVARYENAGARALSCASSSLGSLHGQLGLREPFDELQRHRQLLRVVQVCSDGDEERKAAAVGR